MSCFETVGYGYSSILCEDIASWFINKFVPRHKFYVRIVHKGLKREQSFGFCDFVDQAYRPRVFVIEVQSHLSKEMYTKTLLHELWHIYQHVQGHLKDKRSQRLWKGVDHSKTDYEDQPWEVEAHKMEDILFEQYSHHLIQSNLSL